MNSFYRASAITCLAAVLSGSFVRGSAQTKPAPADQYIFHLMVSGTTAKDKLSCPTVTVPEGQLARVGISRGNVAYDFEMKVIQENGKTVAFTKMTATYSGKVICAPSLTQFIGQRANIAVNGMQLAVSVQHVDK